MARVMVVPVMLILSVFQHQPPYSTSLASGQQEAVDAFRLRNALWVTKNESRVVLSWNNNLTKEEAQSYTVKYVLSYKFFNTTHERTERLQQKRKRIRLELHSGFEAKVKTQLFSKETEDVIKESGWTELTYKAPPVYIQNLSCIIYNTSCFNCTWHVTADAPEGTQILFTYRHAGRDFECQQYRRDMRKKNTGCHMKEMRFQSSRRISVNITVMDLRSHSRGLSYYKAFVPQTIEKLNPPTNVSVSLENRSIRIRWNPPPTLGSARGECFLYQVKITGRKIVDVPAESYEYPFHQPAHTCTAQVRVKKEKCVRNKMWSEWSEPLLIYDGQTVDAALPSFTSFCLLTLLGGLLTCACRRSRCLEVLTMPVPHPSDNIKAWLGADEAHHQKVMPTRMEMHSEVTMETPEEHRDEDINNRKA